MGLLSKSKEKLQAQKNQPKKEEVKEETKPTAELQTAPDTKAPILLNHIETEFDVLYKMVETKGSVPMSMIADFFKVPKKTAEEWAQILDMHSLCELHYPALGEPHLRLKKNATDKKEKGRK